MSKEANKLNNEILILKSIVKDQDQRIAELEAKLAERKEFCISQTQSLLDINNALIEENNELKQQLAEKEHTITNLIQDSEASKELLKQHLAEKDKEVEVLKLDYEFVSKEYNKLVDIGVSKFKQYNQDKIEFAIAELDKLRQLFIYNYNSEIECIDPYDNNCCLSLSTTLYNTAIDIFNKQIKQLKEMK